MPTIFELLRTTCGLSQVEAAEFLGVSIDNIRSWGIGRRGAPENVLHRLHCLANDVEQAAQIRARKLKRLKSAIDLDTIKNDSPALGAHHAMLGRIIALLPDETEYE